MTDPRNTEFEMFSLFEMTLDLVCIASREGYFRKINPAVSEKLGYSEEELFASPIASFIHPDDRERTAMIRKELLNGRPLTDFQNRYVSKDGSIVWLHWTSVYIPDKEIVFAIAKDVTARKMREEETMEKYRKFKSLATHFKTCLEKDRKYLAVELHEELAQVACVLKMDMDWVSHHAGSLKEDVRQRIDHALSMSDLLISTIRRISYSISPKMLEDEGMNEALKWLCQEFSILNGIPCQFESACADDVLAHEIQLDLFRICQEALSNVMYHAEASTVKITITDEGAQVSLCIADDGKGFIAEQQKQASGLNNMYKRTASINGRIVIDSFPGSGTRICVSIDPKLGQRLPDSVISAQSLR
jgi:PAS domain S-box-containing protein